MLPHALIVQVPRGADVALTRDRYATKADTVVHIQEHKKEKGVATGIFIEDIRDLQQTVRTAKRNSRTIVIFSDASTMTHQAQNALLKLLEEPRDGLYLLLHTSSPQSLLPTVRSRCQLQIIKNREEVALPADKKARIEFMSAGNIDEQVRLVDDARYYQQQEQFFEYAKQLVGGSMQQKLAAIKQVKDSRTDALETVHASLIVAQFMLKKDPSQHMTVFTKKLLSTESALRRNGNVGLWLLTCVV